MQNVSAAYKAAISQSSRMLKARITLGNRYNGVTTWDDANAITDFYIQNIKHTHGLMSDFDFEIGIAPMASFETNLLDKDGKLANMQFEDKSAKLEIAVLVDSTNNQYEYAKIGMFDIEKAQRDNKKIKIVANDYMHRFEAPYICNLQFPQTLLQVAQDICSKAGVTLLTTNFVNSGYTIPNAPVFDGVTLRKAIAQVAELAGGYAIFDADGNLNIINLGTSSVVTLDKSSYIDFNNKDLVQASIDKVIVSVGDVSASAGNGANPIYIVDNMFCQNPDLAVNAIYNVLNGMTYMPYKMRCQGNPALSIGDKISIVTDKGTYDTYLCNRSLTYNGGLREDYSAPGKSNTAKESEYTGSLTVDMQNTKAEIKLMKNAISLKVEQSDVDNAVGNAVDGVQVGVRNLAIGTATFSGGNIIPSTIYPNDVDKFGNKQSDKFRDNTIYQVRRSYMGFKFSNLNTTGKPTIVSFYACIGITIPWNIYYCGADGAEVYYNSYDVNNSSEIIDSAGWKQYYLYFPNGANFGAGAESQGIQFVNSDDYLYSVDLYYSSVKVEIGNKLTDWQPAPEDVQGQLDGHDRRIASAELKITPDAITSEVSANITTSQQGTVIVDSADSGVQYFGTWGIENATGYNGGSTRYSNTTGDYIFYKFIGTGVNVYTDKYLSHGNVEIFIDGVSKAVVDLYNATSAIKQKIYSITTLAYGTHDVKLVVKGTKNATSTGYIVQFDYFEILNSNAVNKTDIDNIKVGARNLLLNTSWKSTANWSTANGAVINTTTGKCTMPSASADVFVKKINIQVKPNTTYTYSMECLATGISGGTYGFRMYYRDISTGNWYTSGGYTGDFSGRKTYTFTTSATCTSIDISLDNYNTTSGTVDVWHLKLEEGNKVTDWSPAPEDFQGPIDGHETRISVAEQKITADAITTSVSKSIMSASNDITIVDDKDSSITYSGTWSSIANANDYGGTHREINTTNAYVQYTFVGTGINVYTLKTPASGIMAVSIDGGAETNVDLYYTPAIFKIKVYSITNLSYGSHTIKLRVTGTKNASATNTYATLDYFEILNNTAVNTSTLSTQIQQNSDSVKIAVGQIGGNNLLVNSSFEFGIDNALVANGATKAIYTLSASPIDGGTKAIDITTSASYADSGVYITIPTKAGYTYTVSAYCLSFSGLQTLRCRVVKADWSSIASQNISVNGAASWVRTEITFTATEDNHKFEVFQNAAGASIRYLIDCIQLELGNKATGWKPNPNEIKQVDVTINSSGETITNGKLTVVNSNGTTVIDGTKKMFKVQSEGTFQITTSGKTEAQIQSPSQMQYVLTHNLGYAPIVDVYVGIDTSAYGRLPMVDDFILQNTGAPNYADFDGFTFGSYLSYDTTSTTMTVQIRLTPFMAHWIKTQEIDRTWGFKYYVYTDTQL